jgi:hypothetical protein
MGVAELARWALFLFLKPALASRSSAVSEFGQRWPAQASRTRHEGIKPVVYMLPLLLVRVARRPFNGGKTEQDSK